MNWTGGDLHRHSRSKASDPLAPKQKQFFANARLKRKTTHDGSSFRNPSLQSPRAGPSRDMSTSSTLGPRQHSIQTQTQAFRHAAYSPKRIQSTYGHTSTSPFPGRPRDLETKRKQLLLRRDWVSVGVQKPLPVQFPTLLDGRQQSKWGFGLQDGHSVKPMQPHSETGRLRRDLPLDNASETTHQNRDIRIQIGSQDVHLGRRTQSSVAASSRPFNRRPPSSSSSVSSPRFQHRNATLPDSSYRNSKTLGHLGRSSAAVSPLIRQSTLDAILSMTSSSGRTAGSEKTKVQDAHNQSRTRRRLFPTTESRPTNKRTSPIVYHPKPRRIAQILRHQKSLSPRSDMHQTTVAQLGSHPWADMTLSEHSQNGRWLDFLASPTYQQAQATHGTLDEQVTPNISPGPSMKQALAQGYGFSTGGQHAPEESLLAQLRNASPDSTSPETVFSEWPSAEEQPASRTKLPGRLERFCPTDNRLVTISEGEGQVEGAGDCSLNSSVPVDNFLTHIIGSEDDRFQATPIPKETEAVLAACDGDNTVEIESAEIEHVERQENEKAALKASGKCAYPPDASRPREPSPEEETENEAWMRFINFDDDDSDGVMQAAFNEVMEAAARTFHPSRRSPTTDTSILPLEGHDLESVATFGSSQSIEFSSTRAAAPESPPATVGALAPSVQGTERTATGPEKVPTIFGGSEILSLSRHDDHEHMAGELDATHRRPAADDASMVAQPPESEAGASTIPTFKFAQPGRFIGRLAKPARSPKASPLLRLSVNDRPRRRGQSRKKVTDGRADIRALPDYHDDPIDE